MAVAITVVTMVIPGGATLMLMLILIHIPMLILILIRTFILILSPSTTAGVGVLGKGVTIIAAKARFDRGGNSTLVARIENQRNAAAHEPPG